MVTRQAMEIKRNVGKFLRRSVSQSQRGSHDPQQKEKGSGNGYLELLSENGGDALIDAAEKTRGPLAMDCPKNPTASPRIDGLREHHFP
jgi:hypothetical protein